MRLIDVRVVPSVPCSGGDACTGTLVTASAHIITAVIGSGVLSLAWAIAQLGWVIGPVVLLAFSAITWFCSSLLADCYRAPDPVHGKRNYTYGQAVRAYLGGYSILLLYMLLFPPSSTFIFIFKCCPS
jgi:amino acid permease